MGYSRRERDGLLISVGAALTLVALIVLQSLTGAGLFSARTVTTTVTVTTYDAAYLQLSDAYSSHLTELNDRDVTALADDYNSNATIEWTGVDPGWNGNYHGASDIKILWGSTIGPFTKFSVSDQSQSIGVKGGLYVLNSTLDFRGYSVLGNVSGSVIAEDMYEHAAGNSSWLIARETWNFTQFQGQIPVVSA